MFTRLWIIALLFGVIQAPHARAGTVTYDLAYTDVAGGPSFGVGQVGIDSSVLIPVNSDFTSVLTGFIDAFSLTFDNFPANGPITFTLADLGAAYIVTDASSHIIDLNFWSYDRIAVGLNTCPSCTVPYLAGVSPLVGTVTDPLNDSMSVEYFISLTPVSTPEPSSLALLGASLLGLVVFGRRIFLNPHAH